METIQKYMKKLTCSTEAPHGCCSYLLAKLGAHSLHFTFTTAFSMLLIAACNHRYSCRLAVSLDRWLSWWRCVHGSWRRRVTVWHCAIIHGCVLLWRGIGCIAAGGKRWLGRCGWHPGALGFDRRPIWKWNKRRW